MDHKKIKTLGGGGGPFAQIDLASGSLPAWLSFSRASGAMQYDNTGKLIWGPENLFTNSALAGAVSGTPGTAPTAWSYALGGGTSVVATDPNFGGNSIAITVAANRQVISRVVAVKAFETWIFSVYATTTGDITLSNILHLSAAPAGTVWITNIYVDGVLTASSAIIPAGTYRFSIVAVVAATSGNITFRTGAGCSSNVTGTVKIWATQAERVTYQVLPRTYLPSALAAAVYGPRFDYDPVTLAPRGLLLEGARTNVVLWGRDLTNAAWTLGATMTRAKNQTGIDGVANYASSLTGGAVAATNTILQAIVLANSARFHSAYIKRLVGTGVIEMTMDNGLTWVDVTAQIFAAWSRVTIPTQTLANPTVGFRIQTNGDSIAVDFVQNEDGAVGPSMPIYVDGTIDTRAADVCSFIGAGLVPFNSSQGAIIVQAQSEFGGATGRLVAGSAAGNSYLYEDVGIVKSDNGTTVLSSGVSSVGAYSSFGFAWDKVAPSRRLQATGGLLISAADAPNIGATTQWLGSINGTSNFSFAWFKKISVYNTRLTDTEFSQIVDT